MKANVKIFLLVFLLLLALFSFFQGKSQDKGVRIGFKVAPEISFRAGGWEPGQGYKYTFGQLGGIGGVQVLLNHFETGAYFYTQSVVQNNSGYDIRYTPQFIHIPILYRVDAGSFYFAAGTSLNFNASIGKKIEHQTIPGTVSFTGNSTGESIAFGLHVTMGKTFPISETMDFFTEFRLGGVFQKFAPGSLGLGAGVNWKL